METIINTKLPVFSLQAFHNGEFKTITNQDVEKQWSVLFFYPADFTFVCPTELLDVQEQYAKLKEMGVEVYSVSCDTHFVHKAWHDTSETIKQVEYPMIGDPTALLSRHFGVMIESDGMSYRATFVTDPNGLVKIAEVQDNGIGRNAEELVRKIEAAQFVAENNGEVCPARWKKGDKTITPSIDLVGKI